MGLLALLLTAACGLPLSHGVQEPGPVPAEQRQDDGDIQVLPPGPRDDASADDIVRDFFGAQSDPSNHHASAREFLATYDPWKADPRASPFQGRLLFPLSK